MATKIEWSLFNVWKGIRDGAVADPCQHPEMFNSLLAPAELRELFTEANGDSRKYHNRAEETDTVNLLERHAEIWAMSQKDQIEFAWLQVTDQLNRTLFGNSPVEGVEFFVQRAGGNNPRVICASTAEEFLEQVLEEPVDRMLSWTLHGYDDVFTLEKNTGCGPTYFMVETLEHRITSTIRNMDLEGKDDAEVASLVRQVEEDCRRWR